MNFLALQKALAWCLKLIISSDNANIERHTKTNIARFLQIGIQWEI